MNSRFCTLVGFAVLLLSVPTACSKSKAAEGAASSTAVADTASGQESGVRAVAGAQDAPETTNPAGQPAPDPAVVDDKPAPEAAKGQDLEAAIENAAEKGGTVTAVGSSGKTASLPLGAQTIAETDTYVVAVVQSGAAVGKDAVATVEIKPKTGWKLNQEFPTKLEVSPPADVSVKKSKMGIADAAKWTEKEGAFKVDFKASSAGEKKFSAKFKFAVCTDTTCDPKRAELAWAVPVK